MLSRPLVWWRDVPIDVESGLLTYLSKVWENDIYIVAAHDYESARKQCAWEVGAKSNVHLFTGESSLQENQHTLNALLRDKDTLHIFSGIKGGQRQYLDSLKKVKGAKCVLIMESTLQYGNKYKAKVKKIMYPLIYRYYGYAYRKVISGLFAMGESAVKQYSSYGWKNVLSFMYLPNLEQVPVVHNERKCTKFLYIGRFDFSTKGLDILIEAVKQINCREKWSLDLVGGYGKERAEVIEWCAKQEHVSYVGKWPANSVVARMAEYDVCLIPSRADGWNLTPQQAIYAGIGCITSTGAGSQEIVRNSQAGIIVKNGDIDGFARAMTSAIENPELVDIWKKKAISYQERITVDAVGRFFVEGLAYFFEQTTEKPSKPW